MTEVAGHGGGVEHIDVGMWPGEGLDRVRAIVGGRDVAIFSRSWCPYSHDTVEGLRALGAVPAVVYVDGARGRLELLGALKQLTGRDELPLVFVGGQLVGGARETRAALDSSTMGCKLRAAGVRPVSSQLQCRTARLAVLEDSPDARCSKGDKRSVPAPWSAFPDVVDERVERLNAAWVFIACVVLAALYPRPNVAWAVLGLTVDAALRTFAGGEASPLGCLSTLVVVCAENAAGWEPRWRPGIPQQIASCYEMLLCATAAGTLLAARAYQWVADPLQSTGVACIAAVAALSLLYALFSVSALGCELFTLLAWARVPVVPHNVHAVFLSAVTEVDRAYRSQPYLQAKGKEDKSAPKRIRVALLSVLPLTIDYAYKAKSAAWRARDFDIVRHVKIVHATAAFGIAGLATAWKLASQTKYPLSHPPGTLEDRYPGLSLPTAVYNVVALIALVLLVAWTIVYSAKAWLYPRKVSKEWAHPMAGNVFNLPGMTLVLLSFCVSDYSLVLAKVVFWIAAPLSLFLSILRMGTFLARPMEMEHVNASMVAHPVPNFVSATVGCLLDREHYTEAMRLWFAFAFLSYLLLMFITFYKTVLVKHGGDVAAWMTQTVWIGAPAIMANAYLQVYYDPVAAAATLDGSGQEAFIFTVTAYTALSIAVLLLLSITVHPHLLPRGFGGGHWSVGFPAASLASSMLTNYSMRPGPLSLGIAVAALTAASGLLLALGLRSIAEVLRRNVFVPDQDWGPIVVVRLSHNALSAALPRFVAFVQAAAGDSAPDAVLREELAHRWSLVRAAHTSLLASERSVLYPTYDGHFPGLTADLARAHAGLEMMAEEVDNALAAALLGDGGAASAALPCLVAYSDALCAHMSSQDKTLAACRKHLCLEVQKQVARAYWASTPASVWADLLPWQLEQLPGLPPRLQLLHAATWAMPERAQQLGAACAARLDAALWRRLARCCPEVVPRGAPGWARDY